MHHELVHVVILGMANCVVVDLDEHCRGQPAKSLVAIDQRVVVDDRLEQGGRLGPDVSVGVLSEGGGLWSSRCGAEQTDVSHGWRIAEQQASEIDQIVELEELDRFGHSPSWRRASPWASTMARAAALTIRHGKVALEIFVPGRGPVTLQTLDTGDVLGCVLIFGG